MLPPFTIPSDPSKKITLKEATVADCIDFAEVSEAHEEQVTTLFLNRVQEKSSYCDSATWTGEDRRFALLWYWVHTVKDTEVPESYDCAHCGGTHHTLLDYRTLFEEYREIQGRPERDLEFQGQRIVVRPLTGADLEDLEGMRLGLEGDEKSGAYRKLLAQIRLERFERCLSFGEEKPKDSVAERVKSVLKRRKGEAAERPVTRLGGMTYSEFSELAALAMGKLEEMRHGLNTDYEDGEISLITPPQKCPVTGGMTRLRVPFRNSDQIPKL